MHVARRCFRGCFWGAAEVPGTPENQGVFSTVLHLFLAYFGAEISAVAAVVTGGCRGGPGGVKKSETAKHAQKH